jgi:putative copper resistance protein D
MVAPILLVLGAPMTLALRTLPGPRVPGETSPRQLLLGLLRSRVVAFLTLPVVAAVIFTGSFYVIYFTGLFPALMTSHLGHAFMEVHFLLSGCLFFYVVVGIDPGPRRLSHLVRMFLMAFVMPFHAFFSIAVMSGSTVLGRSYWEILHRTYNTDLMHDQFVGGGLSWAFGEIPIIIVMGAVFVQWVRSDFRDARRIDRAAARAEAAGVEDEHAAYNAYLARLGGASAASAEPPDPTSGQG